MQQPQMGYTLFPDIVPARDPDLCYIPVTDLPHVPFGVYCQHKHDQPVLNRFVALISQYMKDGYPDTSAII